MWQQNLYKTAKRPSLSRIEFIVAMWWFDMKFKFYFIFEILL